MPTPPEQYPAYLIGSSGVPNYGDELILALWLRFLSLSRPSEPVWIDVLDPGVSAVLMAKAHPRAVATNTLWRVAGLCAAAEPQLQDAEAERIVTMMGTPKLDAGLALLRDVRSIQLVGGGYLNSMWPANTLLATLARKVAEVAEIPAWATGQGLAPLDEGTAVRLATAFSRFNLAESRQRQLHEQLTAAGVRIGVDDAFLGFHSRLAGLWNDRRKVEPPRFMLLLQGDLGEREARADIFRLALHELRAAGWHDEPIGLVEAMPPDDAWPRAYLNEAGIDHVFYPFLDLWQHGLPIRAGQYWVSTRFHLHLLASGSGAGGTAISLSPNYYQPKHLSLTELGSGWRVVDTAGQPLSAGSVKDTEKFPLRAREFGQQKWSLARRMYPARRWPFPLTSKGSSPSLE